MVDTLVNDETLKSPLVAADEFYVNAVGNLNRKGRIDGIRITASQVTDFDTEVSNNAAVAANTAKVTNATHTGEVTGSGALTIINDAVTTVKILDLNVTSAKVANKAMTLAKMQNQFGPIFLGRQIGTLGDIELLDGTKATSMLNEFTSVLQGVVPASGGGTTNFLRADGTWDVPPAAAGDMVLADVQTVTGAKTFGTIGGAVGKFILAGSTSGSSIVNAAAVAGTTTITLPGSTDTLVGKATTDTLTNKTLTTPTIASFTNATHDHTNAAGGGTITAAAMSDYASATATFTNKTIVEDGTGNAIKITKYMQPNLFDFTTDVATGDGKYYMHIPPQMNGYNLTYVHAEVITAGTTGTTDIQIHNIDNALDMLSTKLTIDSAETGSDTAAAAAVINTSNDHVNTNDVVRIDVDAISTTAPKGLIVTLGFREP